MTDVARDVRTFTTYAISRFFKDDCLQSAAALTYTSLLALVPLTTITVGILSAFPAFAEVRANIQSLIFTNLVPQVGEVVQEYLLGFTRNTTRLTSVGVIGLMVTSILLLSTIEAAFNKIWRVRESRGLLIRLLSFWAILTMTPLLAAASVSLTTQFLISDRIGGGAGWGILADLLPGIFEFIGLTVLYAVIPNRAIRTWDAVIGAAVAAVCLELSKAGFAFYLQTFPAYQTIYGALATVPIFLIWLYLVWSVVLIGALIAAALPEWRAGKLWGAGVEQLLSGQRLSVALAVLHELAAASRLGVGLRRRTLVKRVPVGGAVLDGMLDELRRRKFVERSANGAWLVSRDLSTATLYDLARALGAGLRGSVGIDGIAQPWQEKAAALVDRADQEQQALLSVPLRDLIVDVDTDAAASEPLAVPSQRAG